MVQKEIDEVGVCYLSKEELTPRCLITILKDNRVLS